MIQTGIKVLEKIADLFKLAKNHWILRKTTFLDQVIMTQVKILLKIELYLIKCLK